jgi:uncharacterized protein YcbK (DUF882 family)
MSVWKPFGITRRAILKLGVNLALAVPAARAMAFEVNAATEERRLELYAPEVDERFCGPYWARGSYLDEALRQVSWLMRDHVTDKEKRIDPELIDTLWQLGDALECERPFEVLSGYRTLETNRALRRLGAAKNSLHVEGKAVDIRISGTKLADLARAATQLGIGGVGYYPRQNFLHLDTGPVRFWASGRACAAADSGDSAHRSRTTIRASCRVAL